MRHTADVRGGKPISGASAINPLVAFYDIHGRKRKELFFYSVQHTTPDDTFYNYVSTIIVTICYGCYAEGWKSHNEKRNAFEYTKMGTLIEADLRKDEWKGCHKNKRSEQGDEENGRKKHEPTPLNGIMGRRWWIIST
jgi:hypothetical protein